MIDRLKITKAHMSNPTKSKTQNPTHFTPPMEIRCKSWQWFHGCSWDFVGLWCARNFQQVSLKNTSTPSWFEISDAHHVYNKPLSCTLQWSTKMLRQFNTKCTKGLQQINTMALEEEVFLLLVRASRQTSMPTPNNTSKDLLSSCTLKKHFIHHMKTRPFGEHKQGSGDNAYIKGKTWQEQKTNKSSSSCNSCAKQADEEKDDFLTTRLFGQSRSCLLARSTIVVITTWQHPKKV